MPTYAEAEKFLLSLVNYEQLPPPMTQDTEGWHLQEFARFLRDLGNPQKQLKIIHVAGTKGKGSTTRMIASLLSALGWKRVGTFTSPHIEHFRERIAIDNKPISQPDFVRALQAVRQAHPVRAGEGFRTTFEILTAMAFWHFREKKCEAVVIETGLGGRLDSTNAATARVALITAIGFEHQRVLGSTLKSIASEKAGIIKPGTGQAIVAPQPPRPTANRQLNCRKTGPAHPASPSPHTILALIPFKTPRQLYGDSNLTSRYPAATSPQCDFKPSDVISWTNLCGALMAVLAFARQGKKSISAAKIRKGIESFRSDGRLELIRTDPFLLLDFAHCPLSAKAVAAACAEHFPKHPVILVLGLMRDRNPHPILKAFKDSGVISCVLTHTPPSPRAPSKRRSRPNRQRILSRSKSCGNLDKALEEALAEQKKNAEQHDPRHRNRLLHISSPAMDCKTPSRIKLFMLPVRSTGFSRAVQM